MGVSEAQSWYDAAVGETNSYITPSDAKMAIADGITTGITNLVPGAINTAIKVSTNAASGTPGAGEVLWIQV